MGINPSLDLSWARLIDSHEWITGRTGAVRLKVGGWWLVVSGQWSVGVVGLDVQGYVPSLDRRGLYL
jgi:hypothetical protein